MDGWQLPMPHTLLISPTFFLHTFECPNSSGREFAGLKNSWWLGRQGGSNTYVTVNNGQEDRIYVPSTSACNVHRCGSNPSQYYAISRVNRGLNPHFKKSLDQQV